MAVAAATASRPDDCAGPRGVGRARCRAPCPGTSPSRPGRCTRGPGARSLRPRHGVARAGELRGGPAQATDTVPEAARSPSPRPVPTGGGAGRRGAPRADHRGHRPVRRRRGGPAESRRGPSERHPGGPPPDARTVPPRRALIAAPSPRGIGKVAPWQPLSESDAIAAPPGTDDHDAEPLGTVTGRALLVGTVTPVVRHPAAVRRHRARLLDAGDRHRGSCSGCRARRAGRPSRRARAAWSRAAGGHDRDGSGRPALADPVPVPPDDQNAYAAPEPRPTATAPRSRQRRRSTKRGPPRVLMASPPGS